MKKLKNLTWVIVFSVSILFFYSCNNDDDLFLNNAVENVNTENENNGNENSESNDNGDSNSNSGNQQQGNDGEITLYKVTNGNITKVTDYKVTGSDLEFQKDTNKHNEIWDLVRKVVPLNQLEKMSEFMIYNGEVSGSAGYVFEKTADLSKWQMGIAINYAYEGGFNNKGELAYTIIHEFGHILTLNDVQLNASISQGDCNNYYPGEGCAKENSYINELYQKYWKDIKDEHTKAQDSQNGQEDFYNKYSNRFVTNYASTNPGEDIAEVFATFVTRKEKPSGATIAEKKILLMYNRNTLVDFRNHIRKNLNLRGKGSAQSFVLPEPGSWKQAKTYGNPKKTKCRH